MGKTSFHIKNNGAAVFTINRPETRNAIDFDVMADFTSMLNEAKGNEKVKVVIVTGKGEKAFCSGGDLKVFHQLKTEKDAYQMLSRMGAIVYDLLTLPKPTIALLNGTAVGGGCEIAGACDFRLASEEAKVGFVQGNLGITTGWGGASILMEKLPAQDAMFMLYTGKLFSALEAKKLGFLHDVYSKSNIDEKMDVLLKPIVNKPLSVLKAYKEAAIRKWEQQHLVARMREEIVQCSKLWDTKEHYDAVESFIKRLH